MPWKSLVGGVMDMFNSALNNMWADSRSRQDRARDWYYYQQQSALDSLYNKQSMDYAARINKNQYDYEYQMESPSARKAQYLQAGLNPGLMYSNGLAGMQGSVGSVQPATSRGSMPNKSMPFDPMSLGSFMDNILKGSQSRSEDADATLKEEQARTEQLKQVTEELNQEIKRKESLYLDKETIAKDIENAKSKEDYDRLVRKREQLDQQIDETLENIKALTRQRDSLTALQDEQKETEQSKQRVNDQTVKESEERTKGYAVDRENKRADTKLKGELSDTEKSKRDELAKRLDLHDAQITELEQLSRKYELDNEYREEVNRIFKKYGIDTSKGGLHGMLERLSVLPLKFLRDILPQLGIDYNPY